MAYSKSYDHKGLNDGSPNMYQDSVHEVPGDLPPPYNETQSEYPPETQNNNAAYQHNSPSVNQAEVYGERVFQSYGQQNTPRYDAQPPNMNRRGSSRLSKIIAIPATDAAVGSPFLRSYPPVLHDYNMPKEAFLNFLDRLNRTTVKSPPLAVLDTAGLVMQFVPLATVHMIGHGIGAASKIGAVALSKGQTELFLHEANKEMFNPRGLKVELAKLEAVARIANMPILDAYGKLDERAPLLHPIVDLEQVHSLSAQQRRLDSLQQWISPLDLTPLPGIEEPTSMMSQWSMKASERQRQKEEEKMLERRADQLEKNTEDMSKAMADYRKEMAKLEEERMKIERKETGKKYHEEMAKLEKDRAKVERDYEKDTGKGKKASKKDKEEKSLRKILWLVIRDLDTGAEVVGPNPVM